MELITNKTLFFTYTLEGTKGFYTKGKLEFNK